MLPARGAELFHGTLTDQKIVGQMYDSPSEISITVIDPDHIIFDKTGQKFERATMPPPDNPSCEPTNRYHVTGEFAVFRAYQLVITKQYQPSKCGVHDRDESR